MSEVATKRESANLCRKVANWYEENRDAWCKGTYKAQSNKSKCGTKMCMVGALVDFAGIGPKTKKKIKVFEWNSVAILNPRTSRAYRALEYVTGRINTNYLPGFNDFEAKDVDVVIKAFRKAANALDHGLNV